MKSKQKINIFSQAIVVFVLLFLLSYFLTIVYAQEDTSATDNDSITISEEEQKAIEKKQKEIKKLEEKSATYEKILQLKQKQKSLLGSQINGLNSEISTVGKNIKENKNKMEELNRMIDELENKITQKEKMIDLQRKILADVVRSYYEARSNISTDVLLGIDTFSNVTTSKDYYGQLGERITEITADLKAMQINLKDERDDLKEAEKALVEVRTKLEEERTKLSATKLQKNSLLIQTQGDEVKYKRRLAKIEKQKQEILGDIDELFNANYAELEAMAKKAPSSYWASTRWYYSQKDKRWGNKNIGNSKSKMKDYGCAISAVSMVFTYYGQRITPGELRKKPIFYWDIISWPKNSSDKNIGLNGNIQLSSSINHGNIKWSTVDKEIKANRPVIVFINAKSGAGHYVVIHHKTKKGKYVVHDPYFGANIYLDSTFELLSKIYKVSVSKKSVNQMILYKKI